MNFFLLIILFYVNTQINLKYKKRFYSHFSHVNNSSSEIVYLTPSRQILSITGSVHLYSRPEEKVHVRRTQIGCQCLLYYCLENSDFGYKTFGSVFIDIRVVLDLKCL